MTYTKAESLSYGYLYHFVQRGYKKNNQGGGRRAITNTATASYLPEGVNESGEPTIQIQYGKTPVIELTPSVLEFVGVRHQNNKPAVNLYNRFLQEYAPEHRIVFDPKHLTLVYGQNPGKVLHIEFESGMIDTDSGRFVEVNGKFLPNYLKEDN